ncbi:DUF3794 domain-containing protein [Inediibacterium massiliense]|uniref:DUF3794 domain-containing protein n=1 Tax=Inediibacterium massiliense TaxID=1658111 RepID=UPI0006B695AE|nr:DUF3794 domain-containing protein [Inediibacterium massiliense]
MNIVKNLIEYEGISDYIPNFSSEIGAFQQLNVQESLDIPLQKPDIEQLLKIKSELSITSVKVIQTSIGVSLEEQTLTGWKAIVEGELRQTVQYVADEPTQSVHAAHFNVPFSSFIILPADFEDTMSVSVKGYIEDIFAKQIGKRKIFKNVTILLVGLISE